MKALLPAVQRKSSKRYYKLAMGRSSAELFKSFKSLLSLKVIWALQKKPTKTLSSDNFEQEIQEHSFKSSINIFTRKFGCSLSNLEKENRHWLANFVPSELDLAKTFVKSLKQWKTRSTFYFLNCYQTAGRVCYSFEFN